MKLYFSRVLILLVFLFTTHVYASDADDIKNAYNQWCSAIGTAKGDPAVIVKFYAPDAILLPTLSSYILINKNGGLNAYFTKLTTHPNMKCTPVQFMAQLYGDIAISYGIYDFSYTDAEGISVVLNSRFTFVYRKINNSWLIINHHSSQLPLTD